MILFIHQRKRFEREVNDCSKVKIKGRPESPYQMKKIKV
jgi:hypothetical protein